MESVLTTGHHQIETELLNRLGQSDNVIPLFNDSIHWPAGFSKAEVFTSSVEMHLGN